MVEGEVEGDALATFAVPGDRLVLVLPAGSPLPRRKRIDGDALRDFNGVEVVVDKMSVPYLDGATIDFADTIERQGFTIDNPQATGTCACGESFH